MENYSDFDPFYLLNIGFTFVDKDNVDALDRCDIIIMPGSKLVAEDLHYMEKYGIASKLIALQESKTIVGICGGYQMLGRRIVDRNNVESGEGETRCLGMLDMETEFLDKKITGSVNYVLNEKIFSGKISGEGYEIHYGKTVKNMELPFAYIGVEPEGSARGNIFGTNIHGIFENREFLGNLLHRELSDYRQELIKNVGITSKLFTDNIDMKLIESLVT